MYNIRTLHVVHESVRGTTRSSSGTTGIALLATQSKPTVSPDAQLRVPPMLNGLQGWYRWAKRSRWSRCREGRAKIPQGSDRATGKAFSNSGKAMKKKNYLCCERLAEWLRPPVPLDLHTKIHKGKEGLHDGAEDCDSKAFERNYERSDTTQRMSAGLHDLESRESRRGKNSGAPRCAKLLRVQSNAKCTDGGETVEGDNVTDQRIDVYLERLDVGEHCGISIQKFHHWAEGRKREMPEHLPVDDRQPLWHAREVVRVPERDPCNLQTKVSRNRLIHREFSQFNLLRIWERKYSVNEELLELHGEEGAQQHVAVGAGYVSCYFFIIQVPRGHRAFLDEWGDIVRRPKAQAANYVECHFERRTTLNLDVDCTLLGGGLPDDWIVLWLSRRPEWQRSGEFETTTRTAHTTQWHGDSELLEGGVEEDMGGYGPSKTCVIFQATFDMTPTFHQYGNCCGRGSSDVEVLSFSVVAYQNTILKEDGWMWGAGATGRRWVNRKNGESTTRQGRDETDSTSAWFLGQCGRGHGHEQRWTRDARVCEVVLHAVFKPAYSNRGPFPSLPTVMTAVLWWDEGAEAQSRRWRSVWWTARVRRGFDVRALAPLGWC
ncbi:hypothetical protein B0H12DRAFT_1076134 [Mycena haematopus]|nr:hypothetical protein B0H12DRAFT_1076134 [Mycena haematopus]